VWFQKISIPPSQRVIGNSEWEGGGGVLKAKIFKGKYDLYWDFQRAGGFKLKKKPSVGGVWIFSGTTQSSQIICIHDHQQRFLSTV